MHLIPPEQAFAFAIALCVIGLTAVTFGIATILDTERGRASAGDACVAFGITCSLGAAHLVGWSEYALPALGAVALVRMALAIAAAARRRRSPEDDGSAERIVRCTEGRGGGEAMPDDRDEITIRFETPIDEGDLFRRPDRPRATMDAVVRQLGEGSSVVALKARRGAPSEGTEKG